MPFLSEVLEEFLHLCVSARAFTTQTSGHKRWYKTNSPVSAFCTVFAWHVWLEATAWIAMIHTTVSKSWTECENQNVVNAIIQHPILTIIPICLQGLRVVTVQLVEAVPFDNGFCVVNLRTNHGALPQSSGSQRNEATSRIVFCLLRNASKNWKRKEIMKLSRKTFWSMVFDWWVCKLLLCLPVCFENWLGKMMPRFLQWKTVLFKADLNPDSVNLTSHRWPRPSCIYWTQIGMKVLADHGTISTIFSSKFQPLRMLHSCNGKCIEKSMTFQKKTVDGLRIFWGSGTVAWGPKDLQTLTPAEWKLTVGFGPASPVFNMLTRVSCWDSHFTIHLSFVELVASQTLQKNLIMIQGLHIKCIKITSFRPLFPFFHQVKHPVPHWFFGSFYGQPPCFCLFF